MGVSAFLVPMMVFSTFMGGVALGAWLRNDAWVDRAVTGTRMEYRGKLYRVILDQ